MKTNCLTLLLCLGILCSKGQTTYNFFVDDSLMKTNLAKEVDNVKEAKIKSFDKKYIKDYKEIYEESFTGIKKLILGKESITDTAINNYLQNIVKQIVQKNDELSNLKLRVIFTRNLWANAYSMGDGTIAFNAGMLFYLKNEAEMAFIISHELAHYYLNHSGKSIDSMVQTINSEGYQKKLKAIAKKEFGANKELEVLAKAVVFDSRKHSRIHEAEADYYAYKFLSKTIFNLNGIISCLKVLDVIEDSTFFKPLLIEEVLNVQDYPFKKKWIEKESSIFSEMNTNKNAAEKREADSLKTHPDCKKRIELLKDSVAKKINNNSVYFITNELNFNSIKEKFLIEGIEYEFINNSLSRNLYYALQLFQQKKETAFAVYSIARDLNAIYMKQKNHTLGTCIDDENKAFDKDYNQLLVMLSRLSLTEIADINYNFCKSNLNTGLQYKDFDKEWKTAQLNYTN